MSKANDYQVDGNHYQQEGTIQHWDFAASQNLDYFQGQITKYVARWKKKNGVKDLEKAKHFLEKYIEVEGKKNNSGFGASPVETQINITRGTLPPKRHEDTTGQKHPFGYDEPKCC